MKIDYRRKALPMIQSSYISYIPSDEEMKGATIDATKRYLT